MPGWTILRIREINKGDYTAVSFCLDDVRAERDLEPARFEAFMSGFQVAGGMKSDDVSAYVTGLIPGAIQKRLRTVSRPGRVSLGLDIEGDSPSRLAYPIHTVPWEAAHAGGGKTWRTAYGAVRVHDGTAGALPGGVSMGIFCCEYTPPLATRHALRETFAASATLGRMYEITSKTAAADFLSLQRNPVFYASCHGEIAEGGHASFLSPGGGCFLTTDPDDIEKNCRARFIDPPPAVICFDACYSAYDPGLARFLLGRGCNVFVGNLFEAAQDGTTAGTTTARELLKALLWSNRDGRHGISDSIRLGSKAAGAKLDYSTVLYVNSALAPDRDAFDSAAVLLNMNRWLLWLLAVASLLVGAAIGEAWFFRVIARDSPLPLRLLWEIVAGAVLFFGVRLFLPTQNNTDRR